MDIKTEKCKKVSRRDIEKRTPNNQSVCSFYIERFKQENIQSQTKIKEYLRLTKGIFTSDSISEPRNTPSTK